jgi:hypothetical protein
MVSILETAAQTQTAVSEFSQRMAIRSALYSSLISIAFGLVTPTTAVIGQTLSLLNRIVFTPVEVDANVAVSAASFVQQMMNLAVLNANSPLSMDIMSTALKITSSCAMVTSMLRTSDQLSSTQIAQAQQMSSSILSVATAVTQASLIGAIPGQSPVVVTSGFTVVSSQRLASASLLKTSFIDSTGVSTARSPISQFIIPPTLLVDLYNTSANPAYAPASLDSSVVTFTSNPFSFADNGTVSASHIVSLTIFSVSASGKTGSEIFISNLSNPIVVSIIHPSKPSNNSLIFTPSCRWWNTRSR